MLEYINMITQSLTKHTHSNMPTELLTFKDTETFMHTDTFIPLHKRTQTVTQSHEHTHKFIHTGTQTYTKMLPLTHSLIHAH